MIFTVFILIRLLSGFSPLFFSLEPENSEERDIKHAVSFFDRAQRAFQQELANVAAAAAASGANANSDNQGSTVLDILTRSVGMYLALRANAYIVILCCISFLHLHNLTRVRLFSLGKNTRPL